MLLKLLHKIEINEILPKSLYNASITLAPKSNKNATKKKLKTSYIPISLVSIEAMMLIKFL